MNRDYDIDNTIELIFGDCMTQLDNIKKESIDLVLCDPPYGTTSCKWDCILPLEDMWQKLKRVVKRGKAILLFGSEPFSSRLRISNIDQYKYDWIWNKKIPSGMCNAKIQPMRQTENISVFIDGKSFYNPQMIKRDVPIKSGGFKNSASGGTMGKSMKKINRTYDYKYPTTILEFNKIRKGSLHPTQKPTDLLEYLIRTYTNEGDTVLDFTMGSGSTGVACVNTRRNFIGIENNINYFNIALDRILGGDNLC